MLCSTLKRIPAALLVATPILIASAQGHALETVRAVLPHGGLWDLLPMKHGIEEGFFEKLGLKVEIVRTRGGSETVQAVVTGSADVGVGVGGFAIMSAYASGAPVRIIGSEIIGAPDIWYYAKSDSGIRTIQDMAGKKLAYTRPGSSSQMIGLELIQQVKGKVNMVSGGGFSAIFTQVMTGQLDAGISIPPLFLDRVNKGDIRIIARGSEAKTLDGMTVRVHIANSNFLKRKRGLVKKFMQGFVQATAWAYANQDKAAIRFAKNMKSTPELAKEGIKFYPQEALRIAPIRGVDRIVKLAVKYKFLEKPLSKAQLDELIDIVYQP